MCQSLTRKINNDIFTIYWRVDYRRGRLSNVRAFIIILITKGTDHAKSI